MTRASGLRRATAGLLDAALAAVLALALTGSTGHWFAERAVVALRIGQPDSPWTGGIPMVLGAVGAFVYGYPFALLLIQLARPLTGTTPGASLTGLHIDGPPSSLRRRHVLSSAVAWGPCLGLALGSLTTVTIGVLIAFASVIASIPVVFRRPSMIDVLSSTSVVRRP